MSDTNEAGRLCILQVHTDDQLELITLPTWCQEKKDLPDLAELHLRVPLVRTFQFVTEPVTLEIDVYSNCKCAMGDQAIENEYASKITGYETFGPLTVVCMCDQKIINMEQFTNLCKENGKFLRKYSDKEKKFSGSYGDMLHRLVLGTAKHNAKVAAAAAAAATAAAAACRDAGACRYTWEDWVLEADSGAAAAAAAAADSGATAAADSGAAAGSGATAADTLLAAAAGADVADVRRSVRSQKKRHIFDL
jgi:hypothetical protein